MIKLCKKCKSTWDSKTSVVCPKCNYYEGWNIGNPTTKMRLTCHRCHHTWITLKNKPPKNCPKCNSPYWHKPRKSSPPQFSSPPKTTTRLKIQCQQCNHIWTTRTPKLPRACPACTSRHWYVPISNKKTAKRKKKDGLFMEGGTAPAPSEKLFKTKSFSKKKVNK